MKITPIINLFLLLSITGFCLVFGVVGFIAEDLKEQISDAKILPEEQVRYHGQIYRNEEMASALLEFNSLKETFGCWIVDWPELGKLFITSLIFGALGGVTKTALLLIKKELLLSDINLLLYPFFGMLIGLLVLGLSYLVPIVLTSGFTEIRRTSLIFFCLFAGLFSEEFITGVKNQLGRFIQKRKSGEGYK